MYKVKTQHLEGLKKQLASNNKLLSGLMVNSTLNARQRVIANKQIKANGKQIKILEDEYYID